MNEKQRANLLRLLRPRHVAVIGGRDAEVVATECARIGFQGPFWPVNPKRTELKGHRCYASVDDLPEAPDAVFLAIPPEAAIETVAKLKARGAGGVVCYTAGFGEIGGNGIDLEARFIAAAGDLAIVGPNCYGVINYVDRLALWPFAHGGSCPGFGAAIITQSGMLSSDITMSQRSVPFTHMVSAGNQTLLRIEDFIDALCDRPEVRAFGLHIEGLKDVVAFERVALKALQAGKPIVALKTGTSRVGSALTVSHTGSLSGAAELYDALFRRLGVIGVTTPAELLETVKLLCVAGTPKGGRLAGFTCSGGGATMLADHGERLGLQFGPPSDATRRSLERLLPTTATVSNPLDYTTPIWGQPERTGPVFQALLADDCDAAVIVQDYPATGLDESKVFYRNDTDAFTAAARERGVPAVVCSTLPENLDAETRDYLVRKGVAPMQGIAECLQALAAGAWHSRRREAALNEPRPPLAASCAASSRVATLDEATAKERLAAAGLPVPRRCITTAARAPAAAAQIGFPVALKMVSARLPHKTEAGAVVLGLRTGLEVELAAARMLETVATYDAEAVADRFLIEEMAASPIIELMVSVRRDAQFGLAMTLAAGGVLVEVIGDARTILLPTTRSDIDEAISGLRIHRLLGGFRGRPAASRPALLDALQRLADFAMAQRERIVEIEINPLFVQTSGVVVVDVLMQVEA